MLELLANDASHLPRVHQVTTAADVRKLLANGALRSDDVVAGGFCWCPARELPLSVTADEINARMWSGAVEMGCRPLNASWRHSLASYENIFKQLTRVKLVFHAYDPVLTHVFAGNEPPRQWRAVSFMYRNGALEFWTVDPVGGADIVRLPPDAIIERPHRACEEMEEQRRAATLHMQSSVRVLVEIDDAAAIRELQLKLKAPRADGTWSATSMRTYRSAATGRMRIGVTFAGPHAARQAFLQSTRGLLADDVRRWRIVDVSESQVEHQLLYRRHRALASSVHALAHTRWFENFRRLRELAVAMCGLETSQGDCLPAYLLLWIVDRADDNIFAMPELRKINLVQAVIASTRRVRLARRRHSSSQRRKTIIDSDSDDDDLARQHSSSQRRNTIAADSDDDDSPNNVE
jgi:hypothetical protein